MLNKKKRIDYNKKKYKNPYFNRDKKIRKNKFKFNYRLNIRNLIFFAIFILLIGIFWLLFFSDLFSVKKIEYTGLSNLTENELDSLVNSRIKTKKYLILRQDSIILLNKNDLVYKISENYNVQGIDIQKKLPSTIIINIKEKGIAAIWQESQNYFYIDDNGGIIKQVMDISDNNEYPIIENKGDLRIYEKSIPAQYDIKKTIELFKLFKLNEGKFELSKIVVDNEPNTIKIVTKNGLLLLFNSNNEIDGQLLKLQSISKDKQLNLENKAYIDLRFGDKIYFK